ncbi:MAG: S9 family peptidase [Verrucomicrobia bacterium]|nr:S9 family peptidase [Verrucomicrobiota bacterium]
MPHRFRPLSLGLLALMAVLPVSAQLALDAARPPVAAKKPKDVTVHGDPRIDDYFWLRDQTDPAVLAHLRAENAYTEAVTAPLQPLRETLYAEMVGRLKETDTNVPSKKGEWYYYSRTEKGKQYPIYCRKHLTTSAPEVVILDVNELAKGEKFMAVGRQAVSDSGHLLAYSVDVTGHRDYQLRVKDLRTGALVPQAVGQASSFVWAADNDTLFYVQEDPVSKRSHHLGRWTLSTGKQAWLFDEKDELFDLRLQRSRDGAYLFCESASKTTSEVRALRADSPAGDWRVLLPRVTDHKYSADYRDGLFYIVTNEGAKNYRIVTAPVATPDRAHWTEFVPHTPAVKISDIDLFARFAVISEREDGLPWLRVIDLRTRASHRIAFPEPVFTAGLTGNLDYETDAVRFTYESLVTPSSVIAYDMAKRTREVLKQTEVLGGYDPAQYRSERVWATATDGTRVPVSLVWRADRRAAGPQPLYLYGYGSYGANLPDSFSSARLSLLDRGVIYAIAHIRGGGELGEPWREAGRMKNKMTTFTDFIACAEHLIKAGYTSPDRLVTSGGSAGGLLMGAVLNLRPDLFHAAVVKVPFVDVLNTMLDASLPLTTSEYIEWGNPNVKAEYTWMRAYSPYENLRAQAYPAILVTTALNDSQVPYWEGAKYVARLRTLKTDARPLLLKISLDPAGHGGASGRYDALRETAFDYAFLLAELKLK